MSRGSRSELATSSNLLRQAEPSSSNDAASFQQSTHKHEESRELASVALLQPLVGAPTVTESTITALADPSAPPAPESSRVRVTVSPATVASANGAKPLEVIL